MEKLGRTAVGADGGIDAQWGQSLEDGGKG